MARIIKKVIKYTPIRTILLYFIIASFLLIAFKFPFSGLFPSETPVIEQPFLPEPTAEICDSIDNDLDGVIDNGLVKTQKCGIGLCESTQSVICENGRWITQPCPGNRWATPEICDGVDNDCDGYIDNNLVPPHCELYQGVCAIPIYRVCGGKEGWLHCTDSDYNKAYGYQVVETDCTDGLDNDCDGAADSEDTTFCHVHTNQ